MNRVENAFKVAMDSQATPAAEFAKAYTDVTSSMTLAVTVMTSIGPVVKLMLPGDIQALQVAITAVYLAGRAIGQADMLPPQE